MYVACDMTPESRKSAVREAPRRRPIVARQRIGKNVPATTNTQAKREILLNVSFSIQSIPYERKAGD
jgi:hypothetical protein